MEEEERDRERQRKREIERERLKGSEGFLFQISPDPQGSSVLVASSTQINLFHQRKHSDHSGLASNAENQQQLHTLATLTGPVEELAQLIIENSHPSTCPVFFFSCSYITALLCCSVEGLHCKQSSLLLRILYTASNALLLEYSRLNLSGTEAVPAVSHTDQ